MALALALVASGVAAEPRASVVLRVHVENAKVGILRVIPLHAGYDQVEQKIVDGEASVHVPRDVPSLICVGAPEVAVACSVVTLSDADDLKLALNSGREVFLNCLLGREPAARAKVTLHRSDVPARIPYEIPLIFKEGRLASSVVASSKGEIVLPYLSPGRYQFEVSVKGYPPFTTGSIDIPKQKKLPDGSLEDRAIHLRDVIIEKGYEVAVEIIDDRSMPVGNAKVAIRQSDDGPLLLVEGQADERGRVVFAGLDSTRPANVTCLAPGFATSRIRLDSVANIVRCRLERLGTLVGRVENESGDAIVGASVRVDTQHSSLTDKEGLFIIPQLPPGDVQVFARARGYSERTSKAAVLPAEKADIGAIVLKPGIHIQGRVADAVTNEPIAGAIVSGVDNVENGQSTTDEKGAYELDTEVNAQIQATAIGYAVSDLVVSGLTKNDFRLESPGTLTVTVWDEVADSACVGCTVVASQSRHVATKVTNGAGEVLFSDLPPGEYGVSREFVSASSSYVTVSGGTDNTSVAVRPREVVHVDLGKKRDRVEVAFTPPVVGRWQLRASGAEGTEIVDPQSSGSYKIERKSQGAAIALVKGTTGVVVGALPPEFKNTRLELRLKPTRLLGRCMRDGAADPGIEVILQGLNGALAGWAVSDVRGEITLENVPPGQYVIQAKHRKAVSITVVEGLAPPVELPAEEGSS